MVKEETPDWTDLAGEVAPQTPPLTPDFEALKPEEVKHTVTFGPDLWEQMELLYQVWCASVLDNPKLFFRRHLDGGVRRFRTFHWGWGLRLGVSRQVQLKMNVLVTQSGVVK